jgi:hypothetical protein
MMKVKFEQVRGFSRQKRVPKKGEHLRCCVNKEHLISECDDRKIPDVIMLEFDEHPGMTEEECANQLQKDLDRYVGNITAAMEHRGEINKIVVSVYDTVILSNGVGVKCVSMLSVAGYGPAPAVQRLSESYVPQHVYCANCMTVFLDDVNQGVHDNLCPQCLPEVHSCLISTPSGTYEEAVLGIEFWENKKKGQAHV